MKRRTLRKYAKATANRKNRPLIYGILFMIAAAATALACGWSYVTDHSVRFNSYRTGRGFYRLPPLPIMYDSKTDKEIAAYEANADGQFEHYETPVANSPTKTTQVWDKALAAVEQENFDEANTRLEEYLAMTDEPTSDEEPVRQWLRNSAYDMLDALTALRQGSKARSVNEYLAARRIYDQGSSQNAEEPVRSAPADKNLDDNWDYLHAAFLYSKHSTADALQAFQHHAVKYPHSEKNEAVLYMIAKLQMESSHSFGNTACGITGKDERGEAVDPAKIEPNEKCRDESWQAAVISFQHLTRKYPGGRYFNDARGWLAYLYRRGGERAKALAEYYRMLGHPTDRNVRLEAKKSLQMIGHQYDDATLDEVERLIADNRDAALAYAYHRIYNHAIDFTYEQLSQWCCYDENTRWQETQDEKKRVTDAQNAGNHELERVARFATSMVKRYPQARLSGAFVLRVAEAQLELQNYREAFTLAQSALGSGLQGDLRAEALWIKGTAQHQQKELKPARTTFSQLIAEFPKAKLTEGARRLLALTAEDQNDLETALEQYLALDYEYDVAYFVDVLMPADRLAKFVASHEHIEKHNELLYALAIRYMRDKRWNEARAAFRRVQTEPQPYRYFDYDEIRRRESLREPDWDWNERRFVKTNWVMQDLKTIDVLEHLERAVEAAVSDEAKAEAMYQLASFQFDSSALLFYNPLAWDGMRYRLLSDLDFAGQTRLPNESQTIFDHFESHDTLARAIPIYLEIVKRFPDTRAAKDAFYSAAVAHERLSALNPYWRALYEKRLFAGQRMVNYADVKSAFPHYQLPRATYGWEPSTRTVSGGPGWAPKPTPLPKLTRTQNIERKFKRYFGIAEGWVTPKFRAVTDGYASYVAAWIEAILAAVVTLLAGYLMLLGFHFRKPLQSRIMQLTHPDPAPEIILPDSESRIEKVIDDK